MAPFGLDVPAKEKSLHRNCPLDATLLAECCQSSICCKHIWESDGADDFKASSLRLVICDLRLEKERGVDESNTRL